ncbi:MAG: ATP-dependent DNA helicase RecG [Acidimicrobiales bacterium]
MTRRLGSLAEIPVTRLSGVGPERAGALARVGVENVLDLLTYYPRRYLDRTREARLADLHVGEEATVLVRVLRAASVRPRRGGRPFVTVEVTDGTGRLELTFFNQPWRTKQLRAGVEVLLFGKLDLFRGKPKMTNPVVDLVGDRTGRIIPVYPQSDKERLYTWDLARWVGESLRRATDLSDPVPAPVRDRFDLIGRTIAFRSIHEPESMTEMAAARRRLVFDELLRIQLALVLRKRALERTAVGIRHELVGGLVGRFHERLPFTLTADQERVIIEIEADLAKPHPMHRLLQGDVGSGKTVVAVSALLVAIHGGHQGALMAPTGVLAEQHFLGVRELLDGLSVPAGTDAGMLFDERPLTVELLTNRTSAAERRRLLAGLAGGTVDLLIGTHALIQEGVEFRSLGLVVVDEQHRFGVEQRAALREKGGGEAVPDVLVMTATPIPRTAAMTVYGDLDVSVLHELPPGRQPVITRWERTPPGDIDLAALNVWDQVRKEVAAGRQGYVVCPLIEESEKLEVRSAEETYDALSTGELAGLRLGLIHGRVTPGEKEKVMSLFRSGAVDVLVATTVIEVGIDVPNATIMVVLDADRFGIAQLHQLRGRVGRGAERSWCCFVGAGATPESEARLTALVGSTDGFELAEVDLELRGEGTIMGTTQSGRNDLKLASLRRDREWVERARAVAFELVDGDPTLAAHPELATEIEAFLGEEEREYLLKS